MRSLADDPSVMQRIFDHIDRKSTDLGSTVWREPVGHYTDPARHALELTHVLRRLPTPFCPSAALPEVGSYVARTAAGVPLIALRGADGQARVFRNACRHRGMPLAEGSGCKRALICPYHAWTYDPSGRLRGVPHESGFPGLDKAARGLVPVATTERHGLVFVTQDGPPGDDPALDEIAGVVDPSQALLGTAENEVAANWKIVAEGFLEGYHLKALHPDTFFPIQFDNLNVVERFGPHSRVTFPYRRIEAQRARPSADRSVDGALTYVYHLFPNVMLVTFSKNITLVVLEPCGVERTRILSYTLAHRDPTKATDRPALDRDLRFIEAGTVQDREAAAAIQRGLASGANETFEFGLFEDAIVHFHQMLQARLADAPA